MKISKLVSVLSALTITASAFAGLAVTANAADSVTAFEQDFTANSESSTDPADYDFTLSYGNGSSSSLVAMTVTDGVLKAVAGPYASNTAGARTGSATAEFTAIGAGNEITLSYTWAWGDATGNGTGSYSRTYIADSSGNKALDLAFYGSGNGLVINGTSAGLTASSNRNKTVAVTATLDMNTKMITALKIGEVYTAKEAISFMSSDATSLSKFVFENSERQNWANTSTIDDVVISYTEAKVAATSMTVNYIDSDSNILKTTTPSVSGKYIGDSVTVAYPKYMNVDGTLYSTDTCSSSFYYKEDVELSADTVVTKTYKATETTGVVFYSEAEDLDGVTISNFSGNAENIPKRSSNASAAYAGSDVTITTLQPGKYKVYGEMYSGNSSGGTLSFKAGSNTFTASADGKYNSLAFSSDEINLTEETNLVFMTSGSNTIDLDFIYVVRTGEASTSTEITAEAVAAYEGKDDSKATAFKATLSNTETSAKVTSVSVESNGTSKTYTAENDDFKSPTLTSANAVIGIVVNGIEDTSATVKVTFE